MNLSIQSLWKRTGKVEKAFAVALLLYLILLAVWPDSGLETFLAFVTYVLGAWIALRLLRIGLRKLTWRLRNRLIVAYAFIAVLPILLILTLVGLGAYILAGQVAVYLVRSELDRRVAALRGVDEDLSASPAVSSGTIQSGTIQRIGEMDRRRFPGLILWVKQKETVQTWPTDANVNWPAKLPANSSGFALREGRYYAWADTVAGDKLALALAPLSRPYLSGIMPGLGDVYFLQRDFGALTDSGEAPPAPASKGKIQVRGGSTKVGADDQGVFRLSPAGGDVPQAALPPPVNRFDVGVRWGSLMRAVDWEHPQTTQSALLVGYTRLSSMLNTVLSQSGDEFGGEVF